MNKQKVNFTIMLMVVVIVIIIASVLGAAKVSVINSIRIIIGKMPWVGGMMDLSDIPGSQIAIIWNIRFPRILLSFLVGFALSVAGVALQGMLKNPMADPYIVGTSSGAAFGAAVAILLELNKRFLGIGLVSIFAFFGALLATLLVYQLARINSRVPVTTLLLAGIAVGQFFTAIMSLIMVFSYKSVHNIIYWIMGSFSSRGWTQVQLAFIPILIGSGIIYLYAKDLNILLLGEAAAQNTGVEVEKVKLKILIISALITAFAVSVSGVIGFVGLIVPHVVRMLIGPDHRVLIPASGIMGGILLIMADTLARTLVAPTEIPVGIITALAGSPFFVYLLRRSKRGI